jgi:hypothetical protein
VPIPGCRAGWTTGRPRCGQEASDAAPRGEAFEHGRRDEGLEGALGVLPAGLVVRPLTFGVLLEDAADLGVVVAVAAARQVVEGDADVEGRPSRD